LPRLVLPRSESEVFLEWVVEWSNFLLSAVVLSVFPRSPQATLPFRRFAIVVHSIVSAFRYAGTYFED
jgi:hypothetical protein